MRKKKMIAIMKNCQEAQTKADQRVAELRRESDRVSAIALR